jgi:hypothetical protein
LLQKHQDLVGLGKAPNLVLRKDASAVDLDVEDAVVTLDEFGFDAELATNRGRQTGGRGQVVSTHAVGDRDPHRRLLRVAAGPRPPTTRLPLRRWLHLLPASP